MSRSTRHRLSVLILLVLICGGALALRSVWLDRAPLTGELDHDFGTVMIDGERATVSHTFQLTNRGDEPLVIAKVTPSCRCTVGKPSQKVVAPGEVVDLETSLRLSGSGERKTHIDLILERGDKTVTQTLNLVAVGRRKQTLWSKFPFFEIYPGQTSWFREFANEVFEGEGAPPAPTIEVPEGFEARFEEWDLMRAGVPSTHQPAVWRGRIKITMNAERHPKPSRMRLAIAPDQELIVELVDKPLSHIVWDGTMNHGDEDEGDE